MAAYDVVESRRRVVAARDRGMSADDARYEADIIISRRTVFRWWGRYDLDGDAALAEGRHGHAWKLTPPIQDWLVAYCQAHPHTPSHALQPLLQAEFGLTVSVSQISEVRSRHGVTYQRPRREKKAP